jgi:murein DD-endopeptidase MepM/ murein hydrolase activator NlpD
VRAHDKEVGSLLTEIERLRSVKLIDQERVERTLADLTRRQVTIEQRQGALLAVGARQGGPSPEATGSIPPSPSTSPQPPKPSPLSDSTPDRHTKFEQRRAPFDARLNQFAEMVAQAEAEQTRTYDRAEQRLATRVRRMRDAFSELGLLPQPKASAFARIASAVGGPFIPLFRPDDPFSRQLGRIREAAQESDALVQALEALPVLRPVFGGVEITSGYGTRIDPFLRQLALHSGVDLRAETGDAVRAAAGGKVTQAGHHGGYGLMVEIDHGNGYATRYAHLSAVETNEGATVRVGALLGRAGSSGRSTAPHLHFEIRLNGEAIDPARFLRVGAKLLDGF